VTTTLPRAPPGADHRQRVGDVVEPERAVDVNLDVAGDAALGERLEVGRPRPHGEHPTRRRVRRPASQAIVARRSNARVVPPTQR
jgi:hypothetical protein